MPDLEDDSDAFSSDGIFNGAYDDENVGAVADFNNMDDTINASSAQQALVSYISKQNRTNHKDHQNCLLACFLSQEEPKNISQALQDESWVEAMQEELLQFKLQKVWILVDLPYGKKVIKALYGLHQAPKVGMETISSFLREMGFRRGHRIMFAVCACAWFQVILQKASHLNAVKRIFRYLKHQPKLGLWYPRDSPFELEAFLDSDYAGASVDRKSTIGGCQFLGRRLISWQCKKQTIVANSTTEAEYVAAANCYGQVLWIQN
ncbi:hypothetical protein Tco_0843534 [Tanacetum coccineum]|uniref:Uncharacterized protein n=2 Tax=Tanacetum coccineum TaxID=301880 RepID=A0ABQ5B5X1_9ASTR